MALDFAIPEHEAALLNATRDPDRYERVVMPGSKGLMIRTNEEFHVVRIATTPVGLSYEGTPTSMLGTGATVMPHRIARGKFHGAITAATPIAARRTAG